MILETVKLTKNSDAALTSYVHDGADVISHAPRTAILVIPGGGYQFVSERENEPIALKFFSEGFNVYALKYSVGKGARDYAPLIEAAYAVKYIRDNAAAHNTDPEKVFSCGFSAGGHLAAWIGVRPDDPHIPAEARTDKHICGMVLSYPVISGGQFAHIGSFLNLVGKKDATMTEREAFSLEKFIDKNTCPAFIWHTANDKTVPVQNSLLLAEALAKESVPFELHVFPDGPHGLALATEETSNGSGNMINPHAAIWFELAVRWIKRF